MDTVRGEYPKLMSGHHMHAHVHAHVCAQIHTRELAHAQTH